MDSIAKKNFFVSGNTSILRTTFSIPPDTQFTRICVLSASIPKTYYMVGDSCTLQIDENGVIISLTFPKGNYDSHNVASTISQWLLNNAQWTYTVVEPFITDFVDDAKYDFSVTNNNGQQPRILVSSSELARLLGISSPNVWYDFTSDSFQSHNIVNFQKHSSLSVLCSAVEHDLLQTFPMENSPYNGNIAYHAFDLVLNSKRLLEPPRGLKSMEFTLTDSSTGVEVDLNGGVWSMEIILWSVTNITDIFGHFMSFILDRYTRLDAAAATDVKNQEQVSYSAGAAAAAQDGADVRRIIGGPDISAFIQAHDRPLKRARFELPSLPK